MEKVGYSKIYQYEKQKQELLNNQKTISSDKSQKELNNALLEEKMKLYGPDKSDRIILKSKKYENGIDLNAFSDWDSNPEYLYINKNVVIPEDYKLTGKNDTLNPLQKINDNLSPEKVLEEEKKRQIALKLKQEEDEKSKQNLKENSKVSLNENNNVNNIKIPEQKPYINKVINSLMSEDNNVINNYIIKDGNKINEASYESSNEEELDEKSINEIKKQKKILTDKDEIIYNFGYTKEQRLEPLNLQLIKDTIIDDIKDRNEKKNEKLKKEANEEKKSNENKHIIEEENLSQNQNTINEVVSNNENNEPKIEKTKINDRNNNTECIEDNVNLNDDFNNDLNLTNEQMNFLEENSNKQYNDFRENNKEKWFKIKHPYLSQDKYNQYNAPLIKKFNLDYYKIISKEQINLNRKKVLEPIFLKQKIILKNNLNKNKNLNSIHNFKSPISKSSEIRNKNAYDVAKNKIPNFDQNTKGMIVPVPLLMSCMRPNSDPLFKKQNINNQIKFNYNPYTYKDYQMKFENDNKQIKLGGLGPNIGNEKWENQKKLLDRKKNYGEFINFRDKSNKNNNKILNKNKNNFNEIKHFNSYNNKIDNNNIILPLLIK